MSFSPAVGAGTRCEQIRRNPGSMSRGLLRTPPCSSSLMTRDVSLCSQSNVSCVPLHCSSITFYCRGGVCRTTLELLHKSTGAQDTRAKWSVKCELRLLTELHWQTNESFPEVIDRRRDSWGSLKELDQVNSFIQYLGTIDSYFITYTSLMVGARRPHSVVRSLKSMEKSVMCDDELNRRGGQMFSND